MTFKQVFGALVGVALAACLAAPGATAAPAEVTIVRDSHGEPHIKGATAEAAMYGFAYAQMEDQSDYVLRNLYEAVGRSAEVEGTDCQPSLVKCFQADQMMHLFRVPEVAKEKFQTLPPADRSKLEAFAAGINAYVEANPARVPTWARARAVTAQDVLASVQSRFVLAQLNRAKAALAKVDTGPPAVGADSAGTTASGAGARLIDVLDDPSYRIEMNASNMFAVDGTKTASGKPILNSDPHLAYEGDTEWYQAQISYPGVDVAGATFRGMPGIGIGNNGHVAWGHTSNQAAIHEQDAYNEVLDPANPNNYMYGGTSTPMKIVRVPIKAQVAPNDMRTIQVRFRYTIHGPVVTDPPAALDGTQAPPGSTAAGSLTASQYEQVGLASELWRESEARNIAQFKQAMSNVQLSQFNTIAADSNGDILYVATSRSGRLNPGVPFNPGVNTNTLLDGANPNNTWVSADPRRPWTGVLSLDELNPVTDPPAHFYENANNTPWTTAPGQLDESDFPYYMRFGQDGTRSRRLRELLTPASGLTLADVDEIAFDDKIEFAPALIDLLDQAVLRPGSSTEATEVADVLDEWGADWGFEADPDSTQFVLFIAWVRALDKQALGFNPQQASADYPEGLVGQPGGATTAQLDEVARAAEAAYEQMMQSPGPGSLTVRTGDLHTMDWGDFHGPIGGGTQDAPAVHMTGCKNAYPASRLVAFPCSAANGSSYMMDVDFADGAMHTARPVSASDDPASPFYTKNAEDYAAARFRAFPLSPAAVAAARTSQLDLVYDPDPKPDEPPRRTHAKLGNVRAAKHLRAHGWVELRFRCGAPAGERCRGSLRIEVRSRALKRNGHRGHDRAGKGTTTVARRHYSLAPGSRKLRVRLDRRARRAVRRHKLNATARWTIAQPQGGEQEGRERLVLRRPKR